MRLLPCFFFLALLFVSLEMLGCGSNRVLESITVSPATADAQDFPGGMVNFTATGNFNKPPMSVTPLTVTWSILHPTKTACPPCAGIDSNGVAQCGGVMGMVTVQATAPRDPQMAMDTMNTQMITGMAQMTCP